MEQLSNTQNRKLEGRKWVPFCLAGLGVAAIALSVRFELITVDALLPQCSAQTPRPAPVDVVGKPQALALPTQTPRPAPVDIVGKPQALVLPTQTSATLPDVTLDTFPFDKESEKFVEENGEAAKLREGGLDKYFNNAHMFVWKKRDAVSLNIKRFGMWEPADIRFVADQLNKVKQLRDTTNCTEEPTHENCIRYGILDVGANIGGWTVPVALISRALEMGHVTAIEPTYENAALLRSSIKTNSLNDIMLLRHAVSNVPGQTVSMKSPEGNMGHAHIHGSLKEEQSTEKFSFKEKAVTISVDLLYKKHPERLKNVYIFKIDVEGHEGAVLDGARNFLTEVRPCWIFIELFPKWLETAGSLTFGGVMDLLHSLGYAMYKYEWPIGDFIFYWTKCCLPNEKCVHKKRNPLWNN